MHILILNWRDIKNPAGGGAEILTHELAKGWAKSGHEVLVLSSMFLGGKKTEIIDGIKFERRGKWWNVHLFAFFYYFKYRNDIDIIIDEVHWFPFFSVIYARKKTVALTCETASKLFFTLFPYPVALIFRGIEKIYLRIYREVPTMTISQSSKKDLVKQGINPKKIKVLKMGINIPKKLKKYPKEKNPTFIYLARINKQKGIFDAVETFKLIADKKSGIRNPQFWIVGSGEESIVREVKEIVKRHNLESSVKFFGFVGEEKKFELLARAHILLIPSAHEGWGLTAIEAAAVETPVVGYDIPGLRDSVENGKTGILSKSNPHALAEASLNFIANKVEYKKVSRETEQWAKKFTWEQASKESLIFLKNQ